MVYVIYNPIQKLFYNYRKRRISTEVDKADIFLTPIHAKQSIDDMVHFGWKGPFQIVPFELKRIHEIGEIDYNGK